MPRQLCRLAIALILTAGLGMGSGPGAVTTALAATVPDPPTGVSAVAGPGQADVTWTPASDGGSPLTDNSITPYIGGIAQTPVSAGLVTDFTVTGLTNGTAYTFTVTAINAIGPGAESAPSLPVIPADVPDAPTGVAAIPQDASATVSWTAPADNGNAITRYTVSWSGGSQDCLASDAPPCDVTGLTNGTSYAFTVNAVNDVGRGPDSAPSDPVTPASLPGAPTNVTATFGDSQAHVFWTAPASDGGSPLVGYSITPYIAAVAQAPVSAGLATDSVVTGLTNGTTYTFTVTASNGVGPGAESDPSSPVTPATFPDAPTSVSAIAGDSAVHVFWTAPASDGGSALIDNSITPYIGGAAQAPVSAGLVTDFVVTGLTNGTTYTFTVTAINGVGPSAESDPSGPVTPQSVPDAPTNVSATPDDSQAHVFWDAPASDGGSPLTGYSITPYIGAVAQAPVSAGLATDFMVTGLTNGTVYTFTVTASNAIGPGPESAHSNPVTPATLPSAPTNVTATSSDSQAHVFWNTPASDGGSPLVGYTITPYVGTVPQTPVSVGLVTDFVVTGLTNGTTYTFTVSASNVFGPGPESAPSLPVTPATIPDAPTNVSVSRGSSQVEVSWTAPASDGGSALIGYTITPYIAGVAQAPVAAGLVIDFVVTGLTNGTTYTFTVTASNGIGPGPESAPSSPVTPATLPDAPTNVTASPGDGQAEVFWTAPASDGGSALIGYSITPYIAGVAQPPVSAGLVNDFVVTGLTNGTAYTFTVSASNGVGPGPKSAPSLAVIPSTVPGRPLSVKATPYNSEALVSWAGPVSDGGSPIINFSVTWFNGTKNDCAASPCMVTGLSNGLSYAFTVVAVNANGPGPASSPSSPVIPYGVPGVPTALNAVPSDHEVTLRWTAPAPNGSNAITGYKIVFYVNGAAKGTRSVTGAVVSTVVISLVNGTHYTFTIAALNDIGTGPTSASSNEVTPGTVPTAPTNVVATAGDSLATVTWTAAAANGSAITDYFITIYVAGVDQGTVHAGLTSRFTITGLVNQRAYTFTVTATNGFGAGPASAQSNAVSPDARSSNPSAPGSPGNRGGTTVPPADPGSRG